MGPRLRRGRLPESEGEARMMMLNRMIGALKKAPGVDAWLVTETKTESRQAFYVLQKLETTRLAETTEYAVTVYHRFSLNGKDFLGSSQFAFSRPLKAKELAEKIAEAVFAASFIKNPAFDLVEGTGRKRSWKQPAFAEEPFAMLDRIANLFFAASRPSVRFNALELFANRTTLRTVNSRGVDYAKTLNAVEIEAIPSCDGEKQKVELYKHYTHDKIDYEVIAREAREALLDVEARNAAEKIGEPKTMDVLLRDENVKEFFETLVEDYSYPAVFRQMTDKKIGDPIQTEVKGDFVTVGMKPSCPADAFDRDGVLLEPVTIVENGVLKDFYGSNQYARYLGMEPHGNYGFLAVPKGKTSAAALLKKPHLEIIALSGIQIDMYTGYIGGEVRLGLLFDGKQTRPVSGFSFSGNLGKCLSDVRLSKEGVRLAGYEGPRYLRLPAMEIL